MKLVLNTMDGKLYAVGPERRWEEDYTLWSIQRFDYSGTYSGSWVEMGAREG